MNQYSDKANQEIKDLKRDIEMFQSEKERVRKIIGAIGGVPNFDSRISRIMFIVLVVGLLVVSLLSGGTLRLVMVELAIALVSAKLIYMMHVQMRVDHFQLWVLSNIEWRVNEICQKVKHQPSHD